MVLKTLQELNREHLAESRMISQGSLTENTWRKDRYQGLKCEADLPLPGELIRKGQPEPGKKQRGKAAVIADIVFYMAIGLVLLIAISSGSSGGAPRSIMGYSYFTVLTSSMQKEIPKGSLILVRQVEPQKLEVGNNITFMRDASTSVTHKIVGIYENYQGSGGRGFQTQGVNNANPDREIVYENNVVGKVLFGVPMAGAVLSGLAANIYIVFIVFGLCLILSFSLRGLFAVTVKKA